MAAAARFRASFEYLSVCHVADGNSFIIRYESVTKVFQLLILRVAASLMSEINTAKM